MNPQLATYFANAGYVNDLLSFDPATWTWTDVSSSAVGISPTGRLGAGFLSAGGFLYVFGGYALGGSLVFQVHQKNPFGFHDAQNLRCCVGMACPDIAGMLLPVHSCM